MASPTPALSFERFVIGSGNTVAAFAARRVAESPGRHYNPLVVTAPAGCGKSHLLQAIAHLARRIDPRLAVRLESADQLADRVSASVAAGLSDHVRAAGGDAEIWLVDDFHEIVGRPRTQREMVTMVDAALAAGWQVVVATATPLAELAELDPVLAERLSRGLNVEIAPPDQALRADLVRAAASELGHSLEDAVVQAMSRLPLESGVAVRSAAQRVVAAIEIEGREVGPAQLPGLLGLEPSPAVPREDEFSGFVADVSSALAAVVETSPWRRRIADAILRWGGEGFRTRRLEAALEADTAPDVDALLGGFARDVARLRELAAGGATAGDGAILRDPDRVAELEALVAGPTPGNRGAPSQPRTAGPGDDTDVWFLDSSRFVWRWVSVEERVIEEPR